MTKHIVNVSESALMHLCLIGLESYCIPRTPKETYGLLWGSIAAKRNDSIHYQVEHVSTDVEAERTAGWVSYNQRSLQLKKEIIEECWPSLSFVGDFHTHPCSDREEAIKYYRLSEWDRADVEEYNRRFWFNVEIKLSLVMAIYPLGNVGWQEPGRVNGKFHTAKWTLRNYGRGDYYRLFLSAYVIRPVEDGRRHSLIVNPRENDWNDTWIEEREIEEPEHEVYLNVPSVMGNPNFTGELNG